MMRKKRLLFNTVASVINQIVVAICGLILPRAILSFYGSEVNGLLSSVSQFLGLIAFMELGIGAVVQSAMYKPLAYHDEIGLSKIMISARNFFRKIAKLFIIYVLLMAIIYPFIIDDKFDFIFCSLLVIIISISSFAEYYFGIVNQLLLNADQRSYIHLILRSITQVLNVLLCMVLINQECSIQIVKLTTSFIFMLRPLLQWFYVRKYYNINYSIKLTSEPIKQKWNGVAQHLAAVVLDKTDIIILTFFSTLSNISIYSVYYLIVNSMKQLIISGTIGIQSLLGDFIAKGENKKLNDFFNSMEVITHFVITFIFTMCGCLIIPFVTVYTKGIYDTNYIVPVFAVIIIFANTFYSFRNSYNMVIKAAGHYRETQISAIIEVLINIIVSLILVIKLGLIGVAIGTLVAMVYRTIYLVYYLRDNILYRPIDRFFKNLLVDTIFALVSVILCNFFSKSVENYTEILFLAIRYAFICCFIGGSINTFVYKKFFINSLLYLRKR